MVYVISSSVLLGLAGLICVQWALDVKEQRKLIPQRIKTRRKQFRCHPGNCRCRWCDPERRP